MLLVNLTSFPSLIFNKLSSAISNEVIVGTRSYNLPAWGKVPGCVLLGCCQWLSLLNELAADPVESHDKEPEGTSPESDGPGESKVYTVRTSGKQKLAGKYHNRKTAKRKNSSKMLFMIR